MIEQIIKQAKRGDYKNIAMIRDALITNSAFTADDFEIVRNAGFNFLIRGCNGIFEKYAIDHERFALCTAGLKVIHPEILREKKEFCGVRDFGSLK